MDTEPICDIKILGIDPLKQHAEASAGNPTLLWIGISRF